MAPQRHAGVCHCPAQFNSAGAYEERRNVAVSHGGLRYGIVHSKIQFSLAVVPKPGYSQGSQYSVDSPEIQSFE